MAVIGDQNSLEPILVKHRRGQIRKELRHAGLLLNDVITSGLPTNREEPGTRAQIE